MPRHSLDLDGLSADFLASRVSSSTLLNLLKENVDLEKTFGVSAEFAETAKFAYEELRDASRRDECDLLQMILCIHCCETCCDMICNSRSSSNKNKKNKKRGSSLIAEVPGQEVMHEAAHGSPVSWLERLNELSSDEMRKMLHSKATGKLEKFGLFLFKKKFGEEETKNIEECVAAVKKVGPDLIEKDQLGSDFQDLVNKTKQADTKAFAKLLRVVGTALMAKHGQAIADKGLDAVELGSCAKVLCAGNMKYELDATGLHKCVWTCPANHLPDQFQAIGVELPKDGENETMTTSMVEADHAGKDLVKEADTLDPKKYEKSKTFSKVNAMKFNFHTAYTEVPLRLLQTNAPADFGNSLPTAFRYHGKCRPMAFELHERVVFTGSKPIEIPHGELVKIERLPGKTIKTWFKKKMQKDELEVKYKGKAYTVKQSDLHREPLAKLQVDEGVREWMHATGDTIDVSLPSALHDPSRKQKDTLWFTVSSGKKDEKKEKTE